MEQISLNELQQQLEPVSAEFFSIHHIFLQRKAHYALQLHLTKAAFKAADHLRC